MRIRLQEPRLPTDKPMDMPRGHPRKGHYYDALVVKRSRAIAAVIESAGGQSRPLSKQARHRFGLGLGLGSCL